MTPTIAATKRRHALFIAFHYPPEASSSGVLRTLKYTRFLSEFGWRVSVITVNASAYQVADPGLQAQIPSDVTVVRTRYINTKRHLAWRGFYPALLALPDVWIGWYPSAVRAALRLAAIDPIDVIYSTSPHATAHLIARSVAKRIGKPWITDFRDPWIEDPPEPGTPDGLVFRTVNRWLERDVVRRSVAIVASTAHLREELRSRYPKAPSAKFHCIANGYDEADFRSLPPRSESSSNRLRIVHAGSINAGFRDPRPVFAALGRLVQRSALAANECDVRFIGPGDYASSADVTASLSDAGLTGAVTFSARVPYAQALQELAGADVLLLLQASEDTVGLVPAKLYEYLRMERPVLAVVRAGAAAEVIEQTRGGWAVDPRDESALDAVLDEVIAAWRVGRLRQRAAPIEGLRRFDRRVLAGQLARLFDSVSLTPQPPVRDPANRFQRS
jgi:glycosyltransferase involved in cell wall biosynthesis